MKHDWENVERGLYRDRNTKGFYQRIRREGLNGKKSADTWQRLYTTKLTEARERLDLRRAAMQAGKLGLKVKTAADKAEPSVNIILDRFEKDGLPNKSGHTRNSPGHVKAALPMLRKKLGGLPISKLNQAALDVYHTWRIQQTVKGDGHRTTDLDIATLSVACSWVARCGLITANPIERHHRYVDSRTVRHAKEVSFSDMTEAHAWAGNMFADPRSESAGWQLLFACMFGSRTEELLSMRLDAEAEKPGWISADGGTLYVRRTKYPKVENPTSAITPDHRILLDAHKAWHDQRYPKNPWYFPGRKPNESLRLCALGRAMRKQSKTKGTKKIEPRTPHGCRGTYVKVRRSNRIQDSRIAVEINHTSGVSTLENVYGGVPPEWLTGHGPKMKWLSDGVAPGWKKIKPIKKRKSQ
jgi:integrase